MSDQPDAKSAPAKKARAPKDKDAALLAALQGIGAGLQQLNSKMDSLIDPGARREPVRERLTRNSRSRNATDRDSGNRVMPRHVHTGRFYVPEIRKKKGMRYFWVREFIRNEPDDSNMTSHIQRGWKPVPADEHPELVPPSLPGREGEKPTIIRNGGMILCWKPEREVREAEEEKRREDLEIMQSVAVLSGGGELNEDSRMPYTIDHNETSVSRVTSGSGAFRN